MSMRISGLASGMDIDDIVSKMMTAERVPLDKLYQKKTYTEWQRDDYRTINTALSELDTLIFEGIGKQASFNKKSVTVSNPDAISVKNVSSTSDFSGTIKNVTQLASAATMVSTGTTTASAQQTLAAQTITIKSINKDGGFDKKVNPDGTTSTEDKVYTLEIKATDTLESVIKKINADSGVTVFFDETTKQFSITAKNTGSAGTTAETAAIQLTSTISDNNNLFTGVMKMDALNSTEAVFTNGEGETIGSAGVNAMFTYNGLDIQRSSNTFIINGAEITLKKEMTATEPAVTFSSTPDEEKVYDAIKKFVDSYNALIANISDKISEKKYRDFPPLTDAQKKEMSEDEIKLWEEKAKKGTLRNDSSLSNLLTKMRTSIYTAVNNTSLNNLAKIGIATTNIYQDGGKLAIDEEKLRAAISEDPNGIYNLFMADGQKGADGKYISLGEQGVARRLRADLKSAMSYIGEKAGKTASSVNNNFTLGRLLDNYEDKISSFEQRMVDLENRYYKQFTAMETAINKANGQSASLMSYFSS